MHRKRVGVGPETETQGLEESTHGYRYPDADTHARAEAHAQTHRATLTHSGAVLRQQGQRTALKTLSRGATLAKVRRRYVELVEWRGEGKLS